MNASKFTMMCRFEGGKPGLYFRDHAAGRIKVMNARNEWIATLIPGELLGVGVDAECVLLSMSGEQEFRVSYGEAACILSAFQQGGWGAAVEVWCDMMDAGLDLDF